MKRQILSLALGLAILGSVNAAYGGDNRKDDPNKETASEKAAKNFHRQYRDISNESWFAASGVFKAEFIKDGHKTTSVYGKRGNWIYTIERYTPDNLSRELIDRVKTQYDNYYISGAEKVDQPALSGVYIVHLENKDSYKTIMVSKDDIVVMEEFRKG